MNPLSSLPTVNSRRTYFETLLPVNGLGILWRSAIPWKENYSLVFPNCSLPLEAIYCVKHFSKEPSVMSHEKIIHTVYCVHLQDDLYILFSSKSVFYNVVINVFLSSLPFQCWRIAQISNCLDLPSSSHFRCSLTYHVLNPNTYSSNNISSGLF